MQNDSNANLTAGYIDLATYDELEKYIYGGSDATSYFVRETVKSTWLHNVLLHYLYQTVYQILVRSGLVQFRVLGYLLGTWLNVTTPLVELDFSQLNGPSSNKCIAWTPNFMHALVKECCISFNDLVARFDSSFSSGLRLLLGSKQKGYSEMIERVYQQWKKDNATDV